MSVQPSVPGPAPAFEFLRALYPEGVAPHHLLMWSMAGKEKRSHWFASIETAVEFASTTTADAVYFGLGLSPRDFGPYARCKADEIAMIPGLACDLDVYCPGVHEKDGLPPNLGEALRILPERFPPSIVWSTGHGLQAAWLFKERQDLTSQDERDRTAALSQRWHAYLAGEAKRVGYTIDAVHDLSRVLRLPGSMNNKVPDDPQPVQVIQHSDQRYDPSDLENILDTFGVPEIEVKSRDDRGRLELGDLRVTPRVELSPDVKQKLDTLLVNDSDFARAWRREKRMKDNSWSGHAMSITNVLAYVNFSDQDIIHILSVHRREHGDPGKQQPKPLSWFTVTIGKARKLASEQQERDRKRERREAQQKEAETHEAQERVLIAEGCTGEPEAQKVLRDLLELDVRRLVQIGNDVEPGYRLELADGRVVTIPSLAAMTSFAAFNRYIWRYLRTALPGKAKKQWRAVSIALAKLIVVEDTGLGRIELMLADLGEYFATANHSIFEHYPVEDFPNGPPFEGGRYTGWRGWLVRAESKAEYLIALAFVARPRRDVSSIPGVYYLPSDEEQVATGTEDAGAGRVIFSGPHLYDWLRQHKDRKFEIDELNRRLVDAGFRFRDTALECGVRLRRVWRGALSDATVDDHQFARMDELVRQEGKAQMRRSVVQ